MNLFKRKKKAKKDIFENGNFNINDSVLLQDNRPFAVSVVYANDFVNTIYPACAACYGITKEKTYDEKIEYIARRVKAHHTSILEHSNIILQVYVPLDDDGDMLYNIRKANPKVKLGITDLRSTNHQNLLEMISQVRDCCKYLTINSRIVNKELAPTLVMTIGGSIRGYRNIFENIENRRNELFIGIMSRLKEIIPKEFFIDFIEDDLMPTYEIPDIESNVQLRSCVKKNIDTSKKSGYVDIIRMDDLDEISVLTGIDKDKCLEFVSISTNFKGMSRVITQQLTRHRNAITQESQRYVNYKDHGFNSPFEFKEKYDETTVYKTEIGDYNLQELGNKLMGIYNSLVEQGVDKEDARGYLPQNNQCGKIFITFTLKSLLVFLNLRLDKHAQSEIREYAKILAEMTNKYGVELGYETMCNLVDIYSNNYSFAFVENFDIDEEIG